MNIYSRLQSLISAIKSFLVPVTLPKYAITVVHSQFSVQPRNKCWTCTCCPGLAIKMAEDSLVQREMEDKRDCECCGTLQRKCHKCANMVSIVAHYGKIPCKP